MIANPTSTENIAARMLARYGIGFIWDTHNAAAAPMRCAFGREFALRARDPC